MSADREPRHPEVIQRADGRYGWRLTAANGQIVGTDGAQGYENRDDAQRMADRIVLLPEPDRTPEATA